MNASGVDDPLAGLPDLATLARYDAALRQVPTDVETIQAAIGAARERLERADAAGDRQDALALLGYLGNGLRLLRRVDEAVAHLDRAVSLAAALGHSRAEVACLIRLGEAHRSGDDLSTAERLFRSALDRIRADPAALGVYEDFALQHLGKCLTDAGRAAEAIARLEAALELRRAKGDPGLIESTEAALRAARAAAGDHAGPGSA